MNRCPRCQGPAGDYTDVVCDACRQDPSRALYDETPGSTWFQSNIPHLIGEGLPEIHRLRVRGALQKTWDYLNRDVELQSEFGAVLELIVDWARMREATAESRFGPVPRASEDVLRAFLSCTCDENPDACPIVAHHHAKAERLAFIGKEVVDEDD